MLLTNFMKDTASLPGVEESTRVSWDTKNVTKHKTNISTLLDLSQSLR